MSKKTNENKNILKHIFAPPVWVIVLSMAVAVVLLTVTFRGSLYDSPIAYITYLESTYAFIVLCGCIPGIGRCISGYIQGDNNKYIVRFRKFMNRYHYTSRYMNDKDFRATVSLYIGFAFNCIYVLFKCGTGIRYHSVWFMAIGVYYLVLGLIRLTLLRSNRTIYTSYKDNAMYHEYISYRRCGILLLVLDVAISAIGVQMVYRNESYSYPRGIIYFSALYTFYYFITAIINVVSFGKRERPLLSAAKQLSLAAAWMAMYALQTAMIAVFGGGSDSFRRFMNSVTGVCVFVYVLFTAVRMIVHGTRQIRRLNGEREKQ